MHDLLINNPTKPIQQFYGKWPFYRLLGIQEPASTLFSIMNFVSHYKGYRRVRKLGEFEYGWLLMIFSLSGMNTWIWSSVFHSRDTLLTEKLDYFSAMLYILVNLFYGMPLFDYH